MLLKLHSLHFLTKQKPTRNSVRLDRHRITLQLHKYFAWKYLQIWSVYVRVLGEETK